ncbi:MAG: type II secretion system F family protein [Thermodesulfovibrionales bacterium]
MPIFQYKGYKADGAYASGTVEADSLHDAISGIKEQDIFPKEVKEYLHREGRFIRKDNKALLPYVTRQLSTLLSSGVPLMEALRSLSEEHSGFWKGLLVDIRERVSSGAGLSRALEDHEKIFPEFYRAMVAAGEQSGTLDRILERLADFLEKQTAVQARIRIALIYPAFMVCVGFMVMSFLFAFVIPKIVKIFENTKSALPFVTVVLINVSNFFVHYWWLVLFVITASAFGLRRLREQRRDLIDTLKLRMPGNLVPSLYYARFARTLGFLLDGGLPMLKSLELSAKAVGNIIIGNTIRNAAERVAEGARLSASLYGFPPVLLQLIATGERGGRMAEVLSKAADSYEEEFGRRVQKALSLLEPSMILAMGLIVGFIVLAVLLPMFQLNQLVR